MKARQRAERRRQLETLNGVQKPEWGIKKSGLDKKKGDSFHV
jgi:hypothetical protein